jgi:hypothetical protein
MADLFRSAEMSFLEAIVPEEALKPFAHRLAIMGCAEIVDVRRDFHVCVPIALSQLIVLSVSAVECRSDRVQSSIHQGNLSHW